MTRRSKRCPECAGTGSIEVIGDDGVADEPMWDDIGETVLAELQFAYRHCERAEMILIVLDALDQAGAPLSVQADVQGRIADWDESALAEALDKWRRGRREVGTWR